MNNSKIILDIILKNIQKTGRTEKQCLIDCNINTSFLTDWKNEKIKNPSIDKIVKLSEYLKIDLNYLLLGKSNSSHHKELSSEEIEMLDLFNKVDSFGRIRLLERAETLAEQADTLRLKDNQLQHDNEKPLSISNLDEAEDEADNCIEIPLYDTCVSAGTGIDIDYTSSDPIQVSSDEFDDTDFAVRVSGDSMEPRYFDGDIVIVEPTPAVDQGEVGIFILNGQAFIKKLGDCCLISLNPSYDPIKINDYDSIYCQGRVIGVIPHK
ncbi:MAG: helix-turn-helix domain-containing protein [Ruminiclostridium sp.]